jgi:hypothetical protein
VLEIACGHSFAVDEDLGLCARLAPSTFDPQVLLADD